MQKSFRAAPSLGLPAGHRQRGALDLDPFARAARRFQRHHHRLHGVELFHRHADRLAGRALGRAAHRAGACLHHLRADGRRRDPVAALADRAYGAGLLRGAIGLSLAGLDAIAESWFNGKSDNAHRGSATRHLQRGAIPRLVGRQPGFSTCGSGRRAILFLVAAAIVAGATVPLLMAPGQPPQRPARPALRFGWLFKMSPVASAAPC